MPILPLGGLVMAVCPIVSVSHYFVWLDVDHPAEHGRITNDLLMLFFLGKAKLKEPDVHRSRGERIDLAECAGLAPPIPAAGHLLAAGEARIGLHPEDALSREQVDRLAARLGTEDHPGLACLERLLRFVLAVDGHAA